MQNVIMAPDIKRKAVQVAAKKVRIGSRVPEENREWLKRHGIVTDGFLPQKTRRAPFLISPPFWFWRTSFAVCVCAGALFLAIGWFGDHRESKEQLATHSLREQSMANSNLHLRNAVESLSVLGSNQRSEIDRLGKQIREMAAIFGSQIQGFRKVEAMSDALSSAYDKELDRMSDRYDAQVAVLRKDLAGKDEIISSLEYSLQSADGIVVRADPLTIGKEGLTNGVISAVNTEFQFVIVSGGQAAGVQLGQKAELYHQGVIVGYGQVEKVYPEYSGVRVFSETALLQVEAGDQVYIHLK